MKSKQTDKPSQIHEWKLCARCRRPSWCATDQCDPCSQALIPPALVQVNAAPPHDKDMEQCLLGAMMIEPEAREAGRLLSPEDFYYEAHGIAWKAIMSLHHAGLPVDIYTVQNRLLAQGFEWGDAPWIINLTELVPSAANAGYYARAVKEKSIERRAWNEAVNTLHLLSMGEEDLDHDAKMQEIYEGFKAVFKERNALSPPPPRKRQPVAAA